FPLMIICALVVPLTIALTPHAATAAPEGKVAVQELYWKLPLWFEANQGQTDGQVQFLSRGKGYSLFLTPTEAVLVVRNLQEKPSAVSHQLTERPERTEKTDASVLRMK